MDERADLSISNWWMQEDRLKFFEASVSYISDQIFFVVPPGRNLTTFEKLILPFTFHLWLLILGCFLFGFLVIFIIQRRSKATRNFVFGTGVTNPYFNMFIGFIGGSQSALPKRNFARFLLAVFLMYSLIIRTIYQGSFYKTMRSHKRIKEVQSIDEMIEKDFRFYTYKGDATAFQGTEAIASK